ncbi:hypothetical protein H0H93_011882, partial [Arthromyces matolae]
TSPYFETLKSILALIPNSLNVTNFFNEPEAISEPVDMTYASPFYRLPVEMHVEIFRCLSEDPNFWRPRGPPLVHTVQRKTLAPQASLDPVILSQPTIPLLTAWLERSGTLPLNIFFKESIHGYEKQVNQFESTSNPFSAEVIELLLTQAHRWKAVDFSFSRIISPGLLNIKPGDVPMLETAALSSRYTMALPYGGLPPLQTVWTAFQSSPMFSRARWEIDYLESYLSSVPWSQLTAIEVTMCAESLYEVLPLLERLEDLHYIDPYTVANPMHLPPTMKRERSDLPTEPVTLPRLRRLHAVTYKCPDEILGKLTLPSLASLHLEMKRIWFSKLDPDVFKALLIRSGCTLKEFIYDISGDQEQSETLLMELLDSPTLTTLRHLDVVPTITDKLLNFLTRNVDNLRILPYLEELSLG